MNQPNFDINELLATPTSSWHKKIAADLISEIERHLVEVGTIPEMRRFLAVKGYRELHQRIEREIEGKKDSDALRAMAYAMRNYSLERPGLSAATFRDPVVDGPEWLEAGSKLARTVSEVFSQLGLKGEQVQHALRVLRSLIRGFVIHEMAASYLDSLEYERSYELAIEIFIQGLSALNPK
ncbi:MAG: WHG domain-containing protein [Bradyrhizobium sp.]|uniref:TetR-like C-terminal domain-containing protein n=1 Tax=Bradyrhizobium sp. TaxID=376 RepID=UPI0012032FC3|nr:TetR-like C-terminal domain-containing protein [Bradyrhizobium sp.]THD61924.1 MAG: WHG domain-containing protein [Bradyrhizobium sp.]